MRQERERQIKISEKDVLVLIKNRQIYTDGERKREREGERILRGKEDKYLVNT